MTERRDARAVTLLLRIWRLWCVPRLHLIAFNFLLIVLFSAVNGLYAPIIKHIVDSVHSGSNQGNWILLAALLVTFAKAAALLAHKRMNVRLFSQISVDMQRSLYARLISADLAWLGREPPAAQAARLMADVGAVQGALERIVNNLVRDILMIVALVASMIWIDWQLALIALLIFPLAIMPIASIARTLRKIGRESQAQIARVSARLIEGLAGIQIAKAYQLEPRLRKRTSDDLESLRRFQVREGDHTALVEPLMEVLGGLAVVGILFFVGWRLEAGHNTLGDFAGFITALLLAGQPVRALGNMAAHIQRGLAAAQRVFEVLDVEPAIVDRPGAPALAISSGEVRFDDVSFAYNDGTEALRDISIRIDGGRRLALVGRSGAGKSTLFNLIPRLYDPASGAVLIDGQDIRGVSIESLRRHIAIVTQEATLFDDTVYENIAVGRDDPRRRPTREEIEAAARAAAAHDFIMALPEGYQTRIGDRGDRLSGGQRQRLSIARAFLRDAPILLLDEATSALDAEAEDQVKTALERLSRGRTTIVIAHRLSTIVDADMIAVLDGGRLRELGNHAELMARGRHISHDLQDAVQGSDRARTRAVRYRPASLPGCIASRGGAT